MLKVLKKITLMDFIHRNFRWKTVGWGYLLGGSVDNSHTLVGASSGLHWIT